MHDLAPPVPEWMDDIPLSEDTWTPDYVAEATDMTASKIAPARPSLLVVDDEVPVLRVVERLARKAGFDVETCASGTEALRMLIRKPTDLAMVDLRMPDVNGLDLLRQIKANVPGCEVILMTAHVAAVCDDQLLGGRGHAVRERAVRPCARRVHRRGRDEGGNVRDRTGRHAVPRRSRRAAPVGAGQAAARARIRRSAARRLLADE